MAEIYVEWLGGVMDGKRCYVDRNVPTYETLVPGEYRVQGGVMIETKPPETQVYRREGRYMVLVKGDADG